MTSTVTPSTKALVSPFLKWAGGKTWLVQKYPQLIEVPHKRYIEPFLGSGAVFFGLQPDRAILSDSNIELISTYLTVRDCTNEVIKALILHHKNHTRDYYYKIRSTKTSDRVESAAKFLYLNRTCWNGLYRVNLRGEFNVPIGTKTNVLMKKDNFNIIADLLSRAEIRSSDFEEIIERAVSEDFLFVDPPYHDSTSTTKFIKYSTKMFDWEEHERLFRALIRAHARGARILMTHSYSTSIMELYREVADIKIVDRRDTLAANPNFRGRYREMIISLS